MTTRFRIADLRDENCDRDVFHAETSTWNEARQKATYGHDVLGCALCALLDVVEAARELYGGEEPNDNERTWQRLDETLRRFDFDA